MRSYLVLTENGPLLVLTSSDSITEENLLASLHSKGIDKFIAYEVPVEQMHEFYGVPFEVIAADLERAEDLRVLEYTGDPTVDGLWVNLLGQEIQYEH